MSDPRLAGMVEAALRARDEGRVVDLGEICAAAPELIEQVARLLQLDERLGDVDAHADEPSDPLVGEVLDARYELVACIGVGAMGSVYRARDRSLDREVAVKLLQNGLFASRERRERFEREARVLASIRHPNIVGVHDHGRTDSGLHYLVMELLEGAPLAAVLQRAERVAGRVGGLRRLDAAWLRGSFEFDVHGLGYVPQAVSWCSQVAAALAEAHAAGVVHRDVKPSNVFVDHAGSAVLLDFGIAAREGEGGLTAHGSTIGSPWYMAPEQLGGGEPASRELVDVYGLCATLYHLVTLRPPYEGDYEGVVRDLPTRDPVPPERLAPELSRDLCAVIEKGMERDPRRRYESMAALHDDLAALCAQMPVRARPIRRVARWWRAVRRRPGPAAAALAVVCAVAVAVPLAATWRDEAHAAAAARHERYLDALGGLPPAVAFEGALEARPTLDADERRGYLDRLARVLRHDPADAFARLLQSALLLDQGDHERSLAEVDAVAADKDSAFYRAFRERYVGIDRSRPGVLGLDLADLPEPVTETDRLLLGFQLYRLRRDEAALRVLEDTQQRHARNVRLGTLSNLGVPLLRRHGDRSLLDRLMVEVDVLEREQGGATARSLYYRGLAHLHLEEWSAAAATLEQSRRMSPASYGTNYNLGVALAHLARLDDALERMRAARALRPANVNATQQIASLLAELGDFDAARAEVAAMPERGHTTAPWHGPFFRGFVEYLYALHLYGERRLDEAREVAAGARADFEAARARTAGGSREHRRIGGNLRRLELMDLAPDERCRRLLEALEQQPSSALHLAALATTVEQGGALVPAELRGRFSAFLRRQVRELRALAREPR